jgi:dTDP-4-dehydrorhamnose 3,5-epimerase
MMDTVKLIMPKVYNDKRGSFLEIYKHSEYKEFGNFVQDNLSYSKKGTLRGLHFQNPNPQTKLVQVIKGEVFDVVVDIRTGSPNFGKWLGFILSEYNHYQVFIPEGFAHGFYVMSEEAIFNYKCGDYYHPENEHGIIWNDETIGIKWPCKDENKYISEKDNNYHSLNDIMDILPKYQRNI